MRISVSHWIEYARVVVSAALVSHNSFETSEILVILDTYLTGSRLHKWWYQTLWHVISLQVPVRYLQISARISLDQIYLSGGISRFSISKPGECH
jgi:hypothetical protein